MSDAVFLPDHFSENDEVEAKLAQGKNAPINSPKDSF